MKTPSNQLLIFLIAACLPACDVQPDKVADDSNVYESKSSKLNDGIVLVSSSPIFSKGTRMEQSRQLELKHLGMTIVQGDSTTTGAANIVFKEPRQVEVMSSSIWKIVIGDALVETRTTLRREKETVSETPAALSNVTVIRDGDIMSLDGAVPTDEQKKALESFHSDWFGGNTLFPDKPVKARNQWEVKPELLLSAIMGKEFTNGSGKATLSVKKIFTFDNLETAEIAVSMTHIQGTMHEGEDSSTEVKLNGYGSLYRSLKNPHTSRANLEGSISMNTRSPGMTLSYSGPFECRASSEVTTP